MEKYGRILVAGSQTFTGKAIIRQLKQQGYTNIVGEPGAASDLADAAQVDALFSETSPEYVFMVAGETGGIGANQNNPADLMLDNLLSECHVIRAAHNHRTRKLIYLASSCCYPRDCSQPMKVEDLFTGPLEPTNEAYATAKIAGIKMCQAYRQQYGDNFVVGIPANPFGPGEDFSLERSHVVPALINKMHQAKGASEQSVEIWGTGKPQREFLYGDDLADACIFLMQRFKGAEPINIGSGSTLSIGELAQLVRSIIGFTGELHFDHSKPDGMPIKTLDSTPLLELGWRPETSLRQGITATYQWFLENLGVSKASQS